jgi:hypothetical protein
MDHHISRQQSGVVIPLVENKQVKQLTLFVVHEQLEIVLLPKS